MKLIVAIDTKGDIRAHAARVDDPERTVCGVTPYLTQTPSDSDTLCCRNCMRVIASKAAWNAKRAAS